MITLIKLILVDQHLQTNNHPVRSSTVTCNRARQQDVYRYVITFYTIKNSILMT